MHTDFIDILAKRAILDKSSSDPYKAPVDEADEPAIVAYLASHKGAK
jgi:hypothetical protein